MELTKIFEFDAAHKLIDYKGKCANLHGHRWKLEVTVEAPIKDDGIAIDFSEIKRVVNSEVINILDHSYLNDRITQPTAENIIQYCWEALREHLPLKELRLWESPTAYATFKGK